ncbi:MAG: hypothetical protein JW727_00430 [Candidatus Aenigmarchaeota archaeon]|nr:hypothetical protein [Candidatus Aenigmarchaeota archaeon]
MPHPQDYTFKELVEISRRVIKEFEKIEQRKWSVEASAIELTKQVGDVARRIMVAEGYYLKGRDDDPFYRTGKAELADELSDVICCIVRIADHYGIDLEEAQLVSRRNELRRLGIEPEF